MKLYTETVARVAYAHAARIPVGRTAILLDVAGHRTHVKRHNTAYYGVSLRRATQPFTDNSCVSYAVVWQHPASRRWMAEGLSDGNPNVQLDSTIGLASAIGVATAYNARRAQEMAS